MGRPNLRTTSFSSSDLISKVKRGTALSRRPLSPRSTFTRQEGGGGDEQFKTSTSVWACVAFPGKTVICF